MTHPTDPSPRDARSPLGRRRFLARSARMAAGLAAASVAAPAVLGGESPNERVRVAVVGVRGRGRSHAEDFPEIDGVEVAAVCDVDSNVLGSVAKKVEEIQGRAPAMVGDFRRILDDASIHALVIATPDHWHAPATILACQAGKDVYVEKPCAHNFREGRLMVEAARKYGRVVQHGTQSRSAVHVRDAVELLRSGALGRILQAKALNSQRRSSIGRKPDEPAPPPGVDYDLWLGPAPKRPFNPNRFHYNWHWFWDYGTGDMGNDGVHQLDIARWGLGEPDFPLAVSCGGGKYFFDDDQETPDTQTVVFEYGDKTLVYEMRLWAPYPEHGVDNGNVFYGEKGYMVLHRSREWQVWWQDGKKGPGSEPKNDRGRAHQEDFIACMRSRKRPVADIETGFRSSALAHLGNLAYRVGRRLAFDPKTLRIQGDPEANALLGREYRKGFEVADEV